MSFLSCRQFRNHAHIQAGFGNPFINGRGLIYFGISEMSLTFKVSTRIQGSVSTRAARKANIWLNAHYCRWQEVTFQNFKFKCLWNQERRSPSTKIDYRMLETTFMPLLLLAMPIGNPKTCCYRRFLEI